MILHARLQVLGMVDPFRECYKHVEGDKGAVRDVWSSLKHAHCAKIKARIDSNHMKTLNRVPSTCCGIYYIVA